jgi:uncharacterized protein YndB with AHSA1/START domain
MRGLVGLVTLVGWLALAAPAAAEVAEASSSHFMLRGEMTTDAAPDQTWRALQRIGRWWNRAHTYSGDAANMRLDPRAGGCWCERWGGGQSVAHGRVLLNLEAGGVRTLRLDAPLGPLQEMGVAAILTFTLAPHNQGTKITVTYRVNGDPSLGLDQLAPLVDTVLMEQLGRLGRYSEAGAAD